MNWSVRRASAGLACGLIVTLGVAGATQSSSAVSPQPHESAPAAATQRLSTTNVCTRHVASGFTTCFSKKLVYPNGADVRPHAVQPDSTVGLTPTQLRDAYDLPSTTHGSGKTVAIVVAYNNPWAQSELDVYREQFGLGSCTPKKSCFRKVNQRGEQRDYPTFNAGWSAEAALDVDMVSAICPKCHILLVEADDNSMENLGQAEEKAAEMGADVISNSWGTVDQDLSDADAGAAFLHPGIPVVFATGDYGYMASYPATSAYTVAVGGTTLTAAPDSERGWSEIGWYGAGSWCSGLNPKPPWQQDPECPGRMEADVSAVADPATGVAIYSAPAGGWAVFGGTSAATPIISAAYALAGDTASLTYPVSKAYANPAAFNDVTQGANWGDYDCGGNYFCNSTAGYDGLTGLGSPRGLGGL